MVRDEICQDIACCVLIWQEKVVALVKDTQHYRVIKLKNSWLRMKNSRKCCRKSPFQPHQTSISCKDNWTRAEEAE